MPKFGFHHRDTENTEKRKAPVGVRTALRCFVADPPQ